MMKTGKTNTKSGFSALFIVVAIACALFLVSLTGCSSQSGGSSADQETAARQYLSSVGQVSDDLSEKLVDFEAAASEGDAASIRTAADNALKSLDSLESLEAPDGYSEVQDSYVEGCDLLKSALNSYVELYTDIDSATDEYPFDYSTYDKRLDEIKQLYDDGAAKLEYADQKAAESFA